MQTMIREDEHVLIAGMTGSGKSYLAEVYLAGYDYVVKLDTKREIDERRRDGKNGWRGLKENRDFVVIEKLEELEQADTKKIIYAPNFEEMEDEVYNDFFKWCFLRQNTIIWVDELMSISTPWKYPKYLRACLTQGRSKNVGVWSLTQQPTGIPSVVPANSSHFFGFQLRRMEDRKKMSLFTETEEFLINPNDGRPENRYNFWYYKIGMQSAKLCRLAEGR